VQQLARSRLTARCFYTQETLIFATKRIEEGQIHQKQRVRVQRTTAAGNVPLLAFAAAQRRAAGAY